MNDLFMSLALGGMAQGGGLLSGLMPPSAFAYSDSYLDPDYLVTFTWDPPLSGPDPDNYYMVLISANAGTMTFNIPFGLIGQGVQLPPDEAWTCSIKSRKAGYADSTEELLSGTTPSAPYP
jgi:hypothetical protein